MMLCRKIVAQRILQWVVICSMLFLLAGCSSYLKPQPGNPAIHAIDRTLQDGVDDNQAIAAQKKIDVPADVNSALLPNLQVQSPGQAKTDARRFDISVKNVPASTFFAGLVKGTKYNMVVSPKVQGTITLNLKNVTIEDVLGAVRDNYGYQYRRTAYGFQISPDNLQTRVFTVNYLDVNRSGKSRTTISSGQITQTMRGSSDASNTSSNRDKSGISKKLENSSSIDIFYYQLCCIFNFFFVKIPFKK